MTKKIAIENSRDMVEKLKEIRIEDYIYDLPDERIAKFPLENREASKLLIYDEGRIDERHFYEVPEILDTGKMLVFNNTKVIYARILFQKVTGAMIEVFCLEPYRPSDYVQSFAAYGKCEWKCMVGNLKKWKEGTIYCHYQFEGKEYQLAATLKFREENDVIVEFTWDAPASFSEVLECCGRIPIPPYLNRESEEDDKIRYQTVYSKNEGSVAAPTAGLHFSRELMKRMEIKGIDFAYITLHVGLGNFREVDVEDLTKHKMDSEQIIVGGDTVKIVNDAKDERHKICAVGTTVVRTLESCVTTKGRLTEYDGWTNKFIFPPYDFSVPDAFISNFHLPYSTLLMMVAAFGGYDLVMKAYDLAVKEKYRFGTYGDAMLII